MKYAIVFGVLGVYLMVLSYHLGGAGWLLVWPGVSFLSVAAAYGGLGVGIFGKGAKGIIAWWALLLLLPYFLLTWLVWHLLRLVHKQPCCNEIVPGIWLGRRLLGHELPAEIGLVVDLTAEFPEPRSITKGRSYLCLPTLDALGSEEKALQELVEKIVGWKGNIYIHCANGYGRSATVVAAVLLAKGLADSATQAEEMLKKARPGIRLTPSQRKLLARIVQRLR